jgi:RNA polymerase sigma-70 factor, ECF subfamily
MAESLFGAEEPPPGAEGVAGQTTHVQQLFVKHQNGIMGFILSLLPDLAEAQDVLQEVFLVVTRKAADFRRGSDFFAWACTIARFKVLEARRRRRAAEVMLSAEIIELLCVSGPEEVFADERLQWVSDCVQRLAPRAREMVRMRYFGEQQPEEIARLLAWTPTAVNSALTKARGFLRDCLERHLKHHEDSWTTSA